MNKELGYKFEHMLRAKSIEEKYVPMSRIDVPMKANHDASASLLSIIYAKDSTNLPTGDLHYFVNPKANPEVQKFILDNLMMDVSSNAAPKFPDGLDDDTAFALMREPNESLVSWASRVNEFGKTHSDFVFNALKESEVSDASSE